MTLNRNMTLSIGALALVMTTVGATAHAADVTHFNLRDHYLNADMANASDDGCFVAETNVRFTEAVTFFDGDKFIQPATTQVQVDYANGCTGDVLSLSGGTTTQTFQLLGDLASATLSAVVPVTDGVNSATVTLNLTWTANGPVQDVKDHFHSKDATTITNENFNVSLRTADVTGTAMTSLPTSTGPLPLNLALFPQDGTIGKDAFGSRTVTKIH
jgi:hypothetical protein